MPDAVDFLILAPLTEERDAILAHLPELKNLPPDPQDALIYYEACVAVEHSSGLRGFYRVIVTSPLGMGRVEAATATAAAIRRFSPKYVILVGIAGGAPGSVRLGDVLVGELVADYELQKITDDGVSPRYQPFRAHPRLVTAAHHLKGWESLVRSPRPKERKAAHPLVHFGVMLSGDKVQAKREALQEYKKAWPKLIGVEMEAGGVAAAAGSAASPPGFLMVRGVSDLADAKKGSKSVELWRPYACAVAAAYTVALLRSMPVPCASSYHDPRSSTLSSPTIPDVLDGMRSYPAAGRIQNLIRHYLGQEAGPQPFGGRQAELSSLQAWLADDRAPQRFLLLAPAGQGKTALLCRFCHELQSQPNLKVAFFPISNRFDTHRAAEIFPSLLSRLARIHGQTLPEQAGAGLGAWQLQLHELMRRPPPPGRTILLILDGLDEADSLFFDRTMLPLDLPNGMRVLVAARLLAGDEGDNGWRRRLAWEQPQTARSFMLQPLNEAAVRDAATMLGMALGNDAESSAVVAELCRLSRGNPLVLRLRVQTICQGLAPGRLPDLVELRKLPPGLDGYLEELCVPSGSGLSSDTQATDVLCSLLAIAKGPLQRVDLRELAPELSDAATWKQTLAKMSRVIFGDGKTQGFVFSHPSLKDYFAERLDATKVASYQRRFLEYGRWAWRRLRDGQMAPEKVPIYLLSCLAAHLREGGADPNELVALISEPWLRAWYAYEQSYVGFLRDAGMVREIAEAADRHRALQGVKPQHIIGIVSARLYEQSASSMSMQVHPQLLRALLEEGIWSPARALASFRHHPQEPVGARFQELLAVVAEYLPDELLATAAELAIEQARQPNRYDLSLTKLASRLARACPDESLRLANELPGDGHRFDYLLALFPHLERARAQVAMGLALSIARAFPPSGRAYGLLDLIRRLPVNADSCSPLYQEAWEQVPKVDDRQQRLSLMERLITNGPPVLSAHKLGELLPIFLEEADYCSLATMTAHVLTWEDSIRRPLLTGLVGHTRGRDGLLRWAAAVHELAVLGKPPPDPQARMQQLKGALDPKAYCVLVQAAVEWVSTLAPTGQPLHEMLQAITPDVPANSVDKLIQLASTQKSRLDRAKWLCILVPIAGDSHRLAAFHAAFDAELRIGQASLIAFAIGQLNAGQLDAALEHVSEAFSRADPQDQNSRLACIRTWLLISDRNPERYAALRDQVRTGTEGLTDPPAQAEILLALAERAADTDQQPLLSGALACLHQIADPDKQFSTMLRLALAIINPEREVLFRWGLQILSKLPLNERLSKLALLLNRIPLSDSLRAEVELAIQQVGQVRNDGTLYWHHYLQMARHAKGDQRRELTERAAISAQQIHDLSQRAEALSCLPLSETLLSQWVRLVNRSPHAGERIDLLVKFLPADLTPDDNREVWRSFQAALSALDAEEGSGLESLARGIDFAPTRVRPLLLQRLLELTRKLVADNQELLTHHRNHLPSHLRSRQDSVSGRLRTTVPALLPNLSQVEVEEVSGWIPRRVEFSDLLALLIPLLEGSRQRSEFEAALSRALAYTGTDRAIRLAELSKAAPVAEGASVAIREVCPESSIEWHVARESIDANSAAELAARAPMLEEPELRQVLDLLMSSSSANQTPAQWTASLNQVVAECTRRGLPINVRKLGAVTLDILSGRFHDRSSLLRSIAAMPHMLGSLGVDLASLARTIFDVTEWFDREAGGNSPVGSTSP